MQNRPLAFRDSLLDQEQPSPALRKKYEQEIKKMVHKEITRPQRLVYGTMTAVSAALAVVFIALAIGSHELPILARGAFVAGAAFGLGFAGLFAGILRKGAIDLKRDSNAYSGLIWGFVVLMVTLFMMLEPALPRPNGMQMVLNGLVFLVMGLAFLIQNWIHQSEIQTRIKLTELEMRVAELTEALEGQGIDGSPRPSQ